MKFIEDSFKEKEIVPLGKALIEQSHYMPQNTCSLPMIKRSIVIVEDQQGYLELICEAINECFPDLQIQTAQDGEQAWKLLNRVHSEIDLPFINDVEDPYTYPSLIISDLNLPKLSGLELLTRIKKDPYLQAIPVIIFSTSQDEVDILRCYQAQVNCFITKPSNIEEFFQVVQSTVNFWLNLVALPDISFNQSRT